MAKETITRLVDDLDGGVAHETVTFGLDGHLYEIDLSTRTPRNCAANSPSSSSTAAGLAPAPRRRHAAAAVQRRAGHPDQNRAIREWAQAKGYQIAQRGRIKQDIVDAFHETAGR